MEVLHDWPDDACVSILEAIRPAARPGATVAIIENVIAEGSPDQRGRTLNVLMLLVTGGRERTATELARCASARASGPAGSCPPRGR